MGGQFAVYKGLQKPLIYKGFKGKFIAWGVCALALGLVMGGIIGVLINMYIGGAATLSFIGAGLLFTFQRQKQGLHSKTRNRGIFIRGVALSKIYEKTKQTAV